MRERVTREREREIHEEGSVTLGVLIGPVLTGAGSYEGILRGSLTKGS